MNSKGMIRNGQNIEEPKNRRGLVIFEKLDTEALKEKFNLSNVTVLGDKIYVANTMDEFYVEYVGKELTLFHKNHRGNKRGYHREERKFESVSSVLTYCKHHNNKYKGLGHDEKRGLRRYGNTRMDRLFAQIATA